MPIYPAPSTQLIVPSDHNFLGWTGQPDDVQAGTVMPTAGVVNVVRIKLGPTATAITNIHFHLTVAGSTLTSGQCFAALYTDAGAIVGASAVTASAHSTGVTGWGDSGFKTMPLSVGQAVTPNAWYKVAWWFNGTTGPTMSRRINSNTAITNANLSGSSLRYATADTGVTTTAPSTLAALTGLLTAYWVAVS